MVAARPLQSLAFALFAPLRAEQAGPVANEDVPVDDAPVAVVHDADKRPRCLILF